MVCTICHDRNHFRVIKPPGLKSDILGGNSLSRRIATSRFNAYLVQSRLIIIQHKYLNFKSFFQTFYGNLRFYHSVHFKEFERKFMCIFYKSLANSVFSRSKYRSLPLRLYISFLLLYIKSFLLQSLPLTVFFLSFSISAPW